MASTYVNDLRLNEMATGDASGSWGTVTNTNLELIGEAFSYGTETIGDADSTLTIADGAADAARSFYLKITSSVDLTTTRIVTLGPNTVSKVWMIENATTGSQVITIKQGSGATINVPNGQVKMISTDGAGSGGAVLDLLVDVDLTGTTTLVNLNVSGAVDIAGDLTLSAGGDGALRFTAASSVKVLDNNAAALVFEEADNAYMTFVTTDGSEAVKFDKALDINAATQIDATVTVGVDDTGYDVKFFGATAGKYMLWDESADTLEVSGTVVAAAGTALLPSITTTGDLNTGMWFPAADTIAFSEGGVEALRIDSSGNVGIGTSSPTNGKLEVTNASSTVPTGFFRNTSGSGDSPSLTVQGGANNAASNFSVLDYNGNTDFVVQGAGNVGIGTSSPATKLDVLGSINSGVRVSDGTATGIIYASSEATNSIVVGTTTNHPLVLYTNNASRMTIEAAGNVLIGSGAVRRYTEILSVKNASSYTILSERTGTGSEGHLIFQNGNGAVGTIFTNGTATSYNTSSDYRLKTDAQPMVGASDRVLALKPVNFAWKADGTRVDGFLAHEAQAVVPECVTGTKDAVDEDGNPVYQGIDQSKLVPLLTAALQEALQKIEALEARITALEA